MTKIQRGRQAIKMEETEEDDVRLTQIKIEEDSHMGELPLKVVLDLVLSHRTPNYVHTLFQKLSQEGINEPRLLKQLSREGIEGNLTKKDNFSLGEVSDVVQVRDAIYRSTRQSEDRPQGGKKGYGKGSKRHDDRSRSRSGDDWRRRSGKGPIGGKKGKGKGKKGGRRRSPDREDEKPQSALWKATEAGDVDACRRLLEDQSIDVDEQHKLWTPLMKAAEEGFAEIAQLLLDRGADIKAMNRKGRDSLSFAAAPSMKRPSTDGHRYVLRLLVERGADPLRKDERGQTAKDRAKQEGRDDIVKCLEELESGIGDSFSG
jgi:hypothetical protein